MPAPIEIHFHASDTDVALKEAGRIVLLVGEGGKLSAVGARVDRAAKGAVKRALASEAWGKLRSRSPSSASRHASR
mgnify:CR=1 FL=1